MKVYESKAFLYAINKLSKSDTTSLLLKRKLLEKGFSKEDITKVINYLIKKGYIDDNRYDINYINKFIQLAYN